MSILEVRDLRKKYPSFELNVSFSLEQSRITGLIGRNGAGKTTTLKSMLNLVHPDSGGVRFFGMDFSDNELEIKQRIGFVSGGADFYPNKKLRTITDVSRRFYGEWDDGAYRRYMERFSLEENKTPSQLSNGMKVKYSLALALSHNAQLLILDEPTSGLDPVSRDDLLEVFLNLCDEGITILFSTHITSDLDKCADDIVYIKDGRLIAAEDMKSFVKSFRVLALSQGQLTEEMKPKLIGCKRAKEGWTALIRAQDADGIGVPSEKADLEAIMVHIEKEGA